MFGSINARIKDCVKQLNELDAIAYEEDDQLDVYKIRKLENNLWLKIQVKSLLTQISRQKWIREEDVNTKLYHEGLKSRSRWNQLLELKNESSCVEGTKDMKKKWNEESF